MQTSQEAKAKLDLSPAAFIDIVLQGRTNLLQDVLGELRLLHVDEQNDRGDEWNLKRLLNGPVELGQYIIDKFVGSHSQGQTEVEKDRCDIAIEVVRSQL